MATQLFLTNVQNTELNNPGFSDRNLSASRGASAATNGTTTTSGGTQIQTTVSVSGNPHNFWSPMYQGGVTISGTVTFNIWAFEAATTTNVTIGADVWACDQLGTPVSQVVALSSFVTELGTASAAKQWTATPTSTAILAGQRLRLRLYFLNVGTMAASTASIVYNGPTAAASGDSYVQFTETLTAYTGGLSPWRTQPKYQAVNRSATY